MVIFPSNLTRNLKMTSCLLYTISLMLWGAGLLWAAPIYGEKRYGFDQANWQIICLEAPYEVGELIPSDVKDALLSEGWLQEGELFPAAGKVNEQCHELGLPSP